MSTKDTSLGGDQRSFPETLTEILDGIRHPSPELRRAALERLCLGYWKPVYGYIRMGWAKSNEDAKDLTQAFFSWLSERGGLAGYQPGRAKFRTFLKSLLRHFVQHEEAARGRLKRGGGATFLRLDDQGDAFEPSLADPRGGSPDEIFDREWLRELVRQSIERVRHRLIAKDREKSFLAFQAYDLRVKSERPSYEQLARQLGLAVTDITNHLHVVRGELKKEIRERLRESSDSEEELEGEWNTFLGR